MHRRHTALATAAIVAACAFAGAIAQPGRTGQENPRQPAEEIGSLIPPLEHRVNDRQRVQQLVNDLYAAISGPPGERDWDAFRELFAEGAILVGIDRVADPDAVRRMTVDEYVAHADPILRQRAFFETDAGTEVRLYGGIAHAWSEYETREQLERAPISRGVNSIQCIKEPGTATWKIVTVVWDSEADDNPTPPRRPRPQDIRSDG